MEETKPKLKTLKKNPMDRSNPISKLFFTYMFPLFYRGFKRDLTEDDMYQCRKEHEAGNLRNKLEIAWNKERKRKKDPSLLKVLFKIFRVEIVLLVISSTILDIIRLFQPLALAKLLELFDEKRVEEKMDEAYKYSAIIVFLNIFNVTTTHQFLIYVLQVGMKMRIACSSLIYRKALKLSRSTLVETTVGQIVNLLSNDVRRFDYTMSVHYLILGPIEIIIGMILIYKYVGWIGLTGATILLIVIPLQTYFGKKSSHYGLKTATRTDERIRLMNEIISGIQVIKMYTWEKPFSKLLGTARLKEMKFIKYTTIIWVMLISSGMVIQKAAIFLCIVVYIITGNVLTASFVYTTASYYTFLNEVAMSFPQAISEIAELTVSAKRIKNFLLSQELDIKELHIIKNGTDCIVQEKSNDFLGLPNANLAIQIKNISVKWLKTSADNTLKNISIEANSKGLIAIVGPVGSGKSTLLHVILKELIPTEGSVNVSGVISYASQEPWLFGASVRQNILFGEKYDEKRYKQVVKVCALERDFSLFTHGDKTLIGERGITISGGQRARINLARAVYKEADIYLLDDPLSAVDTHVGKQLFDECICEYLKNKCVIIVTHQLQYLKKVDKIILLNEGQIQVSGTYDDLKNLETNFTKLVAEIGEEEEIEQIKHDENNGYDVESDVDELSKEEKSTGAISWYTYKSYIWAGGHWCKVIFFAIFFVFSQALDSSTEYFVANWVNYENMKQNNSEFITNDTMSQNIINSNTTTLNDFADSFESQWKWWWVFFSSEYTTIYYTVLFLSTIIFSSTSSLVFCRWCLKIAVTMHNKMFNSIINSPMRFFTTNSSGRILNRFSRDIGVLDERLPFVMLDTFKMGLTVIAISMVLASLSLWIVIASITIFVLFYLMRLVYLESTRDIKRIESINCSPIYTQLTTSLQGLTTIRAFRAESILEKEFDNHQNTHSASCFLFMQANRTFAFWLDIICAIYIALVIVVLLVVKHEKFGGNFGLAVTQSMGLTWEFQWMMRQWSELVNNMTTVERIQEYIDLVPEKDDPNNENKKMSKFWPECGKIQFKDVFLRYSNDDPDVLKNLNFVINPREKIGIVGRTGAGKSSLIQALFRLAEIEGSILIDEIDIKTISLSKLRSSISIIPQEPVLFSGTLRKNLDPFDEYKDEVLWDVLEEVELKSAANESPAGLESRMAEGGSNFSVGQRQLFCLARAILRNNKILILDEATANVDPHTDSLIQETIRKKFKDCTVLTIAHRLHTIMDSDKVLVMDEGRAVEFDHPHILLKNGSGIFHSLVEQTGKSTSKNLRSAAEVFYCRDHNGRS